MGLDLRDVGVLLSGVACGVAFMSVAILALRFIGA